MDKLYLIGFSALLLIISCTNSHHGIEKGVANVYWKTTTSDGNTYKCSASSNSDIISCTK